jgi:hypothetical protein
MPDNIRIEVQGLKELQAALKKFPTKSMRYLSAAGKEAASKVILPTVGLKKYPPATSANRPPAPYYIRGVGTQTGRGKRTGTYGGVKFHNHNTLSSERLGTKWYKDPKGYGTEIGNIASYAPYVNGPEQAKNMAAKGWRKLADVIREKMPAIIKVYDAWINKLLKDIKLK